MVHARDVVLCGGGRSRVPAPAVSGLAEDKSRKEAVAEARREPDQSHDM